jgi:N6-adenosine-specific RNA methylase IME4
MRRGIVTNFAKILPMSAGAILADPPWDWAAYGRKGEGRSAKAHYDVMNLEDIKKIGVASVAKPDAALFLWVHNSMVPSGIEIMNAWGFTYKARGFTWLKCYPNSLNPVMGMGKWTRLSTEICLLGTRGKPRRKSGGVRELIIAERREHSRKPDEIYERIEKLVDGPYLELFGSMESQHCENWTRWIGKDRSSVRRWPSNSYPEETAPAY